MSGSPCLRSRRRLGSSSRILSDLDARDELVGHGRWGFAVRPMFDFVLLFLPLFVG